LNKKLGYRPDIEGLSAIGILSVIFFHFQPHWIHGVFLSVDVFFVISGFLFTFIVSNELKNGEFTFIEPYKRRAKRLLPAYFLILFFIQLVVFSIILPNDFRRLINSSVASSIFSSNIYLALQHGGYFENSGEYPLVHTWSLSVEEQFYFLWPIALLLMHKLVSTEKIITTFTQAPEYASSPYRKHVYSNFYGVTNKLLRCKATAVEENSILSEVVGPYPAYVLSI
jgi:peptidoglycan/LPS O-acetylase OafA/YrhL